VYVYCGEVKVGYGIIQPLTGDVPQIAVHRAHRNKGIGSAIFEHLKILNAHPSIKVVNAETTNVPLTKFLTGRFMAVSGMQYEMTLKFT
jgi:ribosomal protein S18 acetylase RimI-like enzyme